MHKRELPPIAEVTIPPDIIAQLEAIPAGHPSRRWSSTPEQDAILLRYWPTKDKKNVAKILGVAESTARNRYRELTNGK